MKIRNIIVKALLFSVLSFIILSCDGSIYNRLFTPVYTVRYDGNGCTGGEPPSAPAVYSHGDRVTVLDNTGGFVRTGCTFAGWNSGQDGGGTGYSPGDFFTIEKANVILYAQWTDSSNIITYNITFDANGGTGTMNSQSIPFGSTANLKPNTFTRAGYNFVGWMLASSGTKFKYADGASYTMSTSGATLYALWTTRTIYHITNDDELYAVRSDLDAYYILDVDVDLSSGYSPWTPIGTNATPFTGEFYADGNTVSGILTSGGGDYQGLFGYISGAIIEDLALTGVSVAGGDNVGSLAGYSDASTIRNCSADGTSVTGAANVGGLVGYSTGTIDSCSGNVPVAATDTNTGGLVGTNSGTITNCGTSASAPVQGRLYAGGLIGVNAATATVHHCYAENTVTGTTSPAAYDTGGLIGRNFADVDTCYATGNVSGVVNVGGLIGLNGVGVQINRCYSRGNTGGTVFAGGFIGEMQDTCAAYYCYATGLANGGSGGGFIGGQISGTSIVDYSYCNDLNTDNGYGIQTSLAGMRLQATYTGWDFTAVWGITSGTNDGYPYLRNVLP